MGVTTVQVTKNSRNVAVISAWYCLKVMKKTGRKQLKTHNFVLGTSKAINAGMMTIPPKDVSMHC